MWLETVLVFLEKVTMQVPHQEVHQIIQVAAAVAKMPLVQMVHLQLAVQAEQD
jgi:predicted aconitase with swiveling domain